MLTGVIVVGLLAYFVSFAFGVGRTVCSSNSSGAGYCDTTAGPGALVSLAMGAVIGGVVAYLVVRNRKGRAAS